MTGRRTHKCPRDGCTRQVAPGLLMCREDWQQVPHDLRQAVTSSWRNGQGARTWEHFTAVKAAIAAINDQPPADPGYLPGMDQLPGRPT